MTTSRFSVHVDGTRFTVEIEEAPAGRVQVRLDGEPLAVDSRLGAGEAGSLLIGATSYAVDVMEEGGELRVVVDGDAFQVRVDPALGPRRAGDAAGAERGQRLVAPMPGRVMAVLVEVGQQVEPGAGLVVLEAMKMENEFRATAAGVVTELPVTPGQAVNAGDLLAVIAPDEASSPA
jgi:biotin carboxyl carrier protein